MPGADASSIGGVSRCGRRSAPTAAPDACRRRGESESSCGHGVGIIAPPVPPHAREPTLSTRFTRPSEADTFAALEERRLERWRTDDTFRRSVQQRRGGPSFVFYEDRKSVV